MNTTQEERNAIFLLAMKSILNHIPFVGPTLEVMVSYRGEVKKNRCNHFTEMLKDYFMNYSPDVDLGKIESDEFGDLFENIIRKVALTRGQNKLEGFKNILIAGMYADSEIDYCEIFAELLSTIQEKEIEILNAYSKLSENYSLTEKRILYDNLFKIQTLLKEQDPNGDNVNRFIVNLLEEEQKLMRQVKKIEIEEVSNSQYRKEIFYNIPKEQYSYYIQDLFNKGLLYDEGIGGIEISPFEIMRMTELGKKFLEYIKEK